MSRPECHLTPDSQPARPSWDEALRKSFSHFAGWTYDGSAPYAPFALTGMPSGVKVVGKRQTDCVHYTAWTLLHALQGMGIQADAACWADMCIWDHDRLWSNVEYLVAKGFALPVGWDVDGWYLVQTWNKTYTSGHSRWVFKYRQEVEVWEASPQRGVGKTVHHRVHAEQPSPDIAHILGSPARLQVVRLMAPET